MDRSDLIIKLDVSDRLKRECRVMKVETLGQLLDLPNDYIYRHFCHLVFGEIEDLRYEFAEQLNIK